MTMKIRVLFADDHALFRQGMAELLDHQPDFRVVGEARDGLEAFEKTRQLRPDLVLMDVVMPRCDGIEATRLIRGEMEEVTIVMLTIYDDDKKLVAAVKNGAQGYLLKSARSPEIVELLRGAMRGEATITQAFAGRLLENAFRVPHFAPLVPPGEQIVLSQTEQDLLCLVADGATDQQIADALQVTISTIKSRMRGVLIKIHLNHRSEAAWSALRE
jgi:DNA-binding NarL/FixJ family response regulator